MEALIRVVVLLALSGVVLTQESLTESPDSDVCLKNNGSLEEGCIAIQVPWKTSFMYICPDQEYKIRKCDAPQNQHPREYESGSLVIKTAWNCFDTISYPDPCISVKCPHEPFNRTECKELKDNTRSFSECCPTYWCGLGEIPDCSSGPVYGSYAPPTVPQSHLALSQAGRKYGYRVSLTHRYYSPKNGNFLEDPKNPDGSYCVPFPDRYNCSNIVHMCKDEQKPGRCPTATEMDPEMNIGFMRQCIGDYTCPGEEKCCKSCSSRFTEGYCMDPITTAE